MKKEIIYDLKIVSADEPEENINIKNVSSDTLSSRLSQIFCDHLFKLVQHSDFGQLQTIIETLEITVRWRTWIKINP